MPEMPEVEVMTRRLRGWTTGRQITGVKVLRGNKFLPGPEIDQIEGSRIVNVFRRGKFIVFQLDRGLMVAHNAMSGFWDTEEEPWTFDYVEGTREATESDVRVKFSLLDSEKKSTKVLNFHDARLFGAIRYYDDVAHPNLIRSLQIGPEAITSVALLPDAPVHSIDSFRKSIQKKHPIKQILLNQERIAGVGNIYACEALWWSLIRPERPGTSLWPFEINLLFISIDQVLNTALKKGLSYEKYLKVYRRSNCGRCNGPVSRVEVAARGTYFCPVCQF